jgi:hypothetical protein
MNFKIYVKIVLFFKVEQRKWQDSSSTRVKKMIKFDAGTTSWYSLLIMNFFHAGPVVKFPRSTKRKTASQNTGVQLCGL